jgi:hypothetical protein
MADAVRYTLAIPFFCLHDGAFVIIDALERRGAQALVELFIEDAILGSTLLAFMIVATRFGLYNNRVHNYVRIRSLLLSHCMPKDICDVECR